MSKIPWPTLSLLRIRTDETKFSWNRATLVAGVGEVRLWADLLLDSCRVAETVGRGDAECFTSTMYLHEGIRGNGEKTSRTKIDDRS